MSIQIDLSKQSIQAFEDAQRCMFAAKSTAYWERAESVMEYVNARWVLETFTDPGSSNVEAGTIIIRGVRIVGWQIIDRYRNALSYLWNQHPDSREKMANAMRCSGNSYVPYLPNDESGFVTAKRKSHVLPGGWRIESGITIEGVRRKLYAAAEEIGLKRGVDILVFTRSQQIETTYGNA